MKIKVELDSAWFRNRFFSLSAKSQLDLAHDSNIIVKKGQKLKIKFIAKSDNDLENIKNIIISKNLICDVNPDFTIVDDSGYEVKCFSATNIQTL